MWVELNQPETRAEKKGWPCLRLSLTLGVDGGDIEAQRLADGQCAMASAMRDAKVPTQPASQCAIEVGKATDQS